MWLACVKAYYTDTTGLPIFVSKTKAALHKAIKKKYPKSIRRVDNFGDISYEDDASRTLIQIHGVEVV